MLGAGYVADNTPVCWQGNPIAFQHSPVKVGALLYVPLADIAKVMGLQYAWDQRTDFCTLKRSQDFKTVRLTLNTKTVKINGKTDELSAPVKLINNDFYVPLHEFLWMLGFFVEQGEQAHFIVTKISAVSWTEQSLRVQGLAPLESTVVKNGNNFELKIANCMLDVPPRSIVINDGVVRKISYRQESLRPAVVRIIVESVAAIPAYMLMREDAENALAVNFSYTPQRTTIAQVEEDEGLAQPATVNIAHSLQLQKIEVVTDRQSNIRVRLLSAGQPLMISKVLRLKNPERLVLTVDDCRLGAITQLPLSAGPVDRVRSSQFSWRPLQTRVVLDLNNNYRAHQIVADGVLVYAQKLAVAKPAVVTTKTVVTQTKPATIDLAPREPRQAVAVTQNIPAKVVRDVFTKAVTIAPVVAPQVPVVTASSLKGVRVIILPGHGGTDAGALTRSGYMEKLATLELSKKVQKLLLDAGAIPLLSREDDESVTLVQQADFAEKNKGDVLVSIHYNSFVVPSAHGTESYWYKPQDLALATAIHEEILKIGGLKNKGIKKAMMHNLNHTTMPGVLVEPLFLSNPKEEALIRSEEFQWKLAKAIVRGLEKYRQIK